jgi:O-6-methylguanine DNA methyltransferase
MSPMRLTIERMPSPIGTILLVSDGAALRVLHFQDDEEAVRGMLRRQFPRDEIEEGRVPVSITAALASYFDGDLRAIDGVPVETSGTLFQRRVWAALREIPAGTTTSYGALAAKLGHPRASRAVGLANGSNPVGLVVPCHRVIGANGSLTGYGGGLSRKQWLLAHEGVRLQLDPVREVLSTGCTITAGARRREPMS